LHLHGVHLTVLLCLQDNQNETAQCLTEILGRGRKEDREGEGSRSEEEKGREKETEGGRRGKEGRGDEKGEEEMKGDFYGIIPYSPPS